MEFEVDRPAPANSSPGDLLITMVKETVVLYKKEFRKMKQVVSLIDLKVMETRNDCETACDCVKRANVVFLVGLRRVAGMRTTSSRHHTRRPDFIFFFSMSQVTCLGKVQRNKFFG